MSLGCCLIYAHLKEVIANTATWLQRLHLESKTLGRSVLSLRREQISEGVDVGNTQIAFYIEDRNAVKQLLKCAIILAKNSWRSAVFRKAVNLLCTGSPMKKIDLHEQHRKCYSDKPIAYLVGIRPSDYKNKLKGEISTNAGTRRWGEFFKCIGHLRKGRFFPRQ